MAQQYNDTNRGIISKNSFRDKDTQPTHKGRINIEGVWYWLSGWTNPKVDPAREFQSLSVQVMTQDEVDKMLAKRAEKEAPQQAAQQQRQAQPAARPQQQAPAQQQTPPAGHPASEPPMDFDDDIPF